ncbi:MAG: tetratricopeptide repeat protein [Nocardioidaceae bacterium]
MTSTPFSRPGAVDLSALKAPESTAGVAGPASGHGAYTLLVDEQSFQGLLEQSMTAPVLLVVYSAARMPESLALADEMESVVNEHEGRYLLGRIDVDAQPGIAQALQVQAIPLVALVLQGRLQPLFNDVPPPGEVRLMLDQLGQQLASQGLTGRHQPLSASPAGAADSGEPVTDPRYAPAEDALVAGDIDTAITEYQKLIDANPADVEAVVGLGRANLLKRTDGADLNAARAAGAANPDDIEAQLLVADLDLLGGHVDDAFGRLVDVVRRTAGDDRDRVRLHLIELFTVVGDDPRVLKARQNLASALY